MIPLYHETPALRATVERLLGDAPLAPTDSRHRFGRLIADADAGIICLRGCTAADLKWLLTVASPGILAPPCIVITPLSIGSLQRLRGIEASRLHVVWTEEVDDRLVDVLAEIEPWYDDPLRLLGHRMLAASSPHRSVVAAVKRICNLSGGRSLGPPETTVIELASAVGVSADTFRRHWREGVPLTCGPKLLLNWAVLLWAVRQRPKGKWDAIARQAGISRRTLERYGQQLAGCTLAEANCDPRLLKRPFREWAAGVSAVTLEAAPTRGGPAQRDQQAHL